MKHHKILTKAIFGPSWGKELQRRSQRQVRNPLDALDAFQSAPPSDADAFEQPIFILSAGWRSGSTLLQRMLADNSELIIWGEPYHRSNIIESLLWQLAPLQDGWPPPEYYLNSSQACHSEQWLANCWPKQQFLRAAHLAYWGALFGRSLRELKRSRWGIKEVRWGSVHINYLKWLYPKAKFVYLHRNPYDAYASFRDYPKVAFLSWPNEPIVTARDYGKAWVKLVSEFTTLAQQGTGVIVRYDNLKSPETRRMLSDYLGVHVADANALSRIVKPGVIDDESTRKKRYVSKLEKYILRHTVSDLADRHGYTYR